MIARARILVAVLAVALVGCGGTAAVGSPSASVPARSQAAISATPAPTGSEAPSDEPSPTPLPGYEDWGTVTPWAVELSLDNDGALRMGLLTRALWFNDERGALLYREVTGDFVATATVRTGRRSEPGSPLPENGVTQFGGVMARGAESASENYVFIVVGNSINGPTAETKSTLNSRSEWDGPAWTGSDAELRLCRTGETFRMYKRLADAGEDEPWVLAAEIDRPDLPAELQVGANIYSDGEPDLTVRWEDLEIREGDPGSDCAAG